MPCSGLRVHALCHGVEAASVVSPLTAPSACFTCHRCGYDGAHVLRMLALIDLFMLGARDPIRFGTRSRIEATLTDQHCCITLSPTTASVAGTDALERGRQHLESIVSIRGRMLPPPSSRRSQVRERRPSLVLCNSHTASLPAPPRPYLGSTA